MEIMIILATTGSASFRCATYHDIAATRQLLIAHKHYNSYRKTRALRPGHKHRRKEGKEGRRTFGSSLL